MNKNTAKFDHEIEQILNNPRNGICQDMIYTNENGYRNMR